MSNASENQATNSSSQTQTENGPPQKIRKMEMGVVGDIGDGNDNKKVANLYRSCETDSSIQNVTDASAEHAQFFKNFKIMRVLREDARHKMITLQGSFGFGDKEGDGEEGGGNSSNPYAVVLLERKAFHIPTLEQNLHLTKSEETLNNDIYSTHNIYPTDRFADMKATVIYPATEKHVSKYSEHEPYIVRETPELYKTVTLPCIEQSKFSIQWVYNILEKKTESERIVVEDSDPEIGFVMVPDMKWDRKDVNALYLVAIIHKHGLRSIRELRREHLPLLKNILTKGQESIQQQFGVSPDKLRIYFHYQPSYYHLHVHFTHVKFDAPGSDTLRAHLIEDVIDNISLDPEFYNKKTLSYAVRENDELFKWYKKDGYFD